MADMLSVFKRIRIQRLKYINRTFKYKS